MQPKGDTFASPLPPGSATVYSCYAGCHLISSHICSSNSQSTMYVHALIFWCADGWSVRGHHRAPTVHTCTVMSVCMCKCVCFVEMIDYMYRDGKSVCKFRLVARPWARGVLFFSHWGIRGLIWQNYQKINPSSLNKRSMSYECKRLLFQWRVEKVKCQFKIFQMYTVQRTIDLLMNILISCRKQNSIIKLTVHKH